MFRSLNKSPTHIYPACKVRTLTMKTDQALLIYYRHKSHYAALGLEPSASAKDIKDAYYSLSLKYHPDKNKGSTELTEKFREITTAYEVLCSPEKKKIYDRDLNIYSNQELRNRGFYTQSSNYYRPSKSRSGKTEHYNYDEHYKHHYEEYFRQRAAEQEHLRRRWEADYRYRSGDRHSWSSNYSTENRYRRERFRVQLLTSKSFIYFMSFWILLGIFGEITNRLNPDTHKPKSGPIYYKTRENDRNE